MTPPPFFLEDLVPGAIFRTGTLTVDTAAITAFAAQFDPQPFHLDPVAAKTSVFGGLVASGWHTAALTMRLLVTSELQLAGGLVGSALLICAGRGPCSPAIRSPLSSRCLRCSSRRADRSEASSSCGRPRSIRAVSRC